MRITNTHTVSFVAVDFVALSTPTVGKMMVGGTWTLSVTVAGGIEPKSGKMLGDNAAEVLRDIAAEFHNRPLLAMLPTHPTPEAVAAHLVERLRGLLPTMVALGVTLGPQTTRIDL